MRRKRVSKKREKMRIVCYGVDHFIIGVIKVIYCLLFYVNYGIEKEGLGIKKMC